ncbi:MAG: TlpA family protein disulfide reductase [Gammaproteobacteria bacterium]|nr:MAG: TlpA family protein disulfide reductase [Gammaproteobacteria bacterium]
MLMPNICLFTVAAIVSSLDEGIIMSKACFFVAYFLLVSAFAPIAASAQDVDYRHIHVFERGEAFPVPPATWVEQDGSHHSLAEFKGRPIVLHFWASWCPPCRSEFGELDAWGADGARSQGVELLALSVDRQIAMAVSFLHARGYKAPVRLADGRTQNDWVIRAIPTTYFIDANGNVRGVVFGAVEWSSPQMQAEISALLNPGSGNRISTSRLRASNSF